MIVCFEASSLGAISPLHSRGLLKLARRAMTACVCLALVTLESVGCGRVTAGQQGEIIGISTKASLADMQSGQVESVRSQSRGWCVCQLVK